MNWYKKSQNATKISLWVDDERDPKNPIIQKEYGSKGNEIWAKTEQEAINYLQEGNVITISLDCDLGENGGRGYKVAEYIEEQAYLGNLPYLEWNVHSQNPVESKKSIQALMNADRYWKNKKS